MIHEVEMIANEHCGCGENPLWDEMHQCLYWTDIPAGRLFRLDAVSGEWLRIYDGSLVGGFTLQEDGNLLLFRDHDIALREDGAEVKVLLADFDQETGRFNDVIADPRGRVFAGTMGEDGSGGVYRVGANLEVAKVQSGTNCSNGQDFSLDLKTYYWSDSTARRIYQFDYDVETGEIAGRKVLLEVPQEWGINDGLTLDSEGCLWVAFYGESAVRRIAPDGAVIETIKMPVSDVTSLIFGGSDWDELFITSAGGKDGSNTQDGALFRMRPGITGRASFRSKVMAL